MPQQSPDQPVRQDVKVSYEATQATFASQFFVTSGTDDFVINFSSGHLADPATGTTLLPVNVRVGLSRSGIDRLISVLEKAREESSSRAQAAQQAGDPKARFPQS